MEKPIRFLYQREQSSLHDALLSRGSSANPQVDEPMFPSKSCTKKQSITLPVTRDGRHHHRILRAKIFPGEAGLHSRSLADP